MRFPQSERVVYTRNPLVEVIAQLRFPRILRIDAELPVAFQEHIRKQYPKLEVRTDKPPVPEPLARVFNLTPSDRTATYQFLDRDEIWKLDLTSTFVALATLRYTRWEEFRARLLGLTEALHKVYDVDLYSRVGLRYKNLICRSEVGLAGTEWSTSLRGEVLGELAQPIFAGSVTHAQRTLAMSVDIADSKVRLSHGLVETEDEAGGATEICYLIDADFFTEAETERRDAEGLLDQYNQESGRLFRWCITPTLHEAMGPINAGAPLAKS